jgi:hypothetical protein
VFRRYEVKGESTFRAVRGIRRLPRQYGLGKALPILLPALREEFHDTWMQARILVGLLSPTVRR